MNNNAWGSAGQRSPVAAQVVEGAGQGERVQWGSGSVEGAKAAFEAVGGGWCAVDGVIEWLASVGWNHGGTERRGAAGPHREAEGN